MSQVKYDEKVGLYDDERIVRGVGGFSSYDDGERCESGFPYSEQLPVGGEERSGHQIGSSEDDNKDGSFDPSIGAKNS